MANDLEIYDNGMCTAAADLSAAQNKFVKVTAAFAVNVCTVSGEGAYGVLQNKPKSGEVASVRRIGVAKVVAGAAVSAGDKVMTNASGQAITAATAGSKIAGVALSAAAGSGEIISVDLIAAGGVI